MTPPPPFDQCGSRDLEQDSTTPCLILSLLTVQQRLAVVILHKSKAQLPVSSNRPLWLDGWPLCLPG